MLIPNGRHSMRHFSRFPFGRWKHWKGSASKRDGLSAEVKRSPKPFNLPADVLHEIFSSLVVIFDKEFHVGGQYQSAHPGWRVSTVQGPELLRLACVCQLWKEVAERYIYRDIIISSYHALRTLAETLSKPENAHLHTFLHSFVVTNFNIVSLDYWKYSAQDLQTICRLCPNLHVTEYVCPFDFEALLSDPLMDEMNWRVLTRLEVHYPGRTTATKAPTQLLGPVTELQSLQELVIYASQHPSYVDDAGANHSQVELPYMPQLRSLSLSKWNTIRDGFPQFLRFVPLLAVELIDCTVDVSDLYIFLVKQRFLEALVITGRIIFIKGSDIYRCISYSFNLVYVCLPMRFIRKGDGNIPVPIDSLRRLILTDEFAQMDKDDLEWLEKRLEYWIKFVCRSHGRIGLKGIRILVSPNTPASRTSWSRVREQANAAGVLFDVDVG